MASSYVARISMNIEFDGPNAQPLTWKRREHCVEITIGDTGVWNNRFIKILDFRPHVIRDFDSGEHRLFERAEAGYNELPYVFEDPAVIFVEKTQFGIEIKLYPLHDMYPDRIVTHLLNIEQLSVGFGMKGEWADFDFRGHFHEKHVIENNRTKEMPFDEGYADWSDVLICTVTSRNAVGVIFLQPNQDNWDLGYVWKKHERITLGYYRDRHEIQP
jgi:hypothetical protein